MKTSFAIAALTALGLSPLTLRPAAAQEVLAPGDLLAGQTQKTWAERWVQWAWPAPTNPVGPNSPNPVLDATGAAAYKGANSGDPNVFFLAGSASGAVIRTVTIGGGKNLFFPLINYIVDNSNSIGSPPTNFTIHEMLTSAFGWDYLTSMNSATLFTEVDGNSVFGLNGYGQISDDPGFYCTYLSNDSFEGSFYGTDMSLGTGVFPSLVQTGQAGFYLALKPLSQGWHTLHFGGEIPVIGPDGNNYGSYTQDITYNINVVPEPGVFATFAALFGGVGIGLVRARRRAR